MYTKLCAYGGKSFFADKMAYGWDVFLGQNMVMVKRAVAWAGCAVSMPALGNHVLDVVELGAEHQMRKVDTQRSVTLVENAHPGRDWAVGQFPCHSMDKFVQLGDATTIDRHADVQHPVAFVVDASEPNTASAFWNRDAFLFKTLGNCSTHGFALSAGAYH